MLLLTLRGTPTLYYGDEIGMTDVPIPTAEVQDPLESRVPGHGLGRDPQRTPMPWSTGAIAAGFTTGRPWLRLGNDAREARSTGNWPNHIPCCSFHRSSSRCAEATQRCTKRAGCRFACRAASDLGAATAAPRMVVLFNFRRNFRVGRHPSAQSRISEFRCPCGCGSRPRSTGISPLRDDHIRPEKD